MDSHRTDRLSDLEARITEIERRPVGGSRSHRSIPGAITISRSLATRLAAAAVALALIVPAGVVLANHQFGDVPASNPFHADIDALADSGVTSGCGNGNYCPKANVTREQMAAFLNRLGALAPGKAPVVNADRVDGLDSSAFLRASIADSITLPGAGFTARNDVPVLQNGTACFRNNQPLFGLRHTIPVSAGSVLTGLTIRTYATAASQPFDINVFRQSPGSPGGVIVDSVSLSPAATGLTTSNLAIDPDHVVSAGEGVYVNFTSGSSSVYLCAVEVEFTRPS